MKSCRTFPGVDRPREGLPRVRVSCDNGRNTRWSWGPQLMTCPAVLEEIFQNNINQSFKNKKYKIYPLLKTNQITLKKKNLSGSNTNLTNKRKNLSYLQTNRVTLTKNLSHLNTNRTNKKEKSILSQKPKQTTHRPEKSPKPEKRKLIRIKGSKHMRTLRPWITSAGQCLALDLYPNCEVVGRRGEIHELFQFT